MDRVPAWYRWGMAITATALLSLVVAGATLELTRRERHWTDGGRLRVEDAAAQVRQVLWTRPEPLPVAGLNGGDHDYEPYITDDELYLVRGLPGQGADILWAHRQADGSWSTPVALAAVNSEADDLGPRLSPDRRWLYLYSNRPGGAGGYDIWIASRTDSGWSTPVNLGPMVNTPADEESPAQAPDGTLYLASNRDQGRGSDGVRWQATVRVDRSTFDLYRAAPAGTDAEGRPAFATVQRIDDPDVNTSAHEGTPAITPAGDFLYFCSDRPGGSGGLDLYRGRLSAGQVREVANLGPVLNSPANETDPCLGQGGFTLWFSSDRTWAGHADHNYGILQANSLEVYATSTWTPVVLTSRHWWLAAATLVATLIALHALRHARWRRLTLLQRAALLSLALHLLALLCSSLVPVMQDTILGPDRERGQELKVVAMSEAAMAEDLIAEQSAPRLPKPTLDLPRSEPVELPPPPNPSARPDLPTTAMVMTIAQTQATPVPMATARPAMPSRLPDLQAPDTPATVLTALAQSATPLAEARPDLPAIELVQADQARALPTGSKRTAPASEHVLEEAPSLAKASITPVRTGLPRPTVDVVDLPLPNLAPKALQQLKSQAVTGPTGDGQAAVVEISRLAAATNGQSAANPTAASTISTPIANQGAARATTSRPLTTNPTGLDDLALAFRPRLLPEVDDLAARDRSRRREMLEQHGGNEASEKAVSAALDFLARTQMPDGRWTVCFDQLPQPQQTNPHDSALTGLAVLAFLAADHVPARPGPYRQVVRRGLDHLLAQLKPDGDLRGAQAGGDWRQGNMYDQGIATVALAEAATMCGDLVLREAATRAAGFIVRAQSPEGGWRYAPGRDADTSVLGWQAMALHSAVRCGFSLPPEVTTKALAWLDKAANGPQRGLGGYQPGQKGTPAMSAEAGFSRLLLGNPPSGPAAQELTGFLLSQTEDPRGRYYYYYYGSHLLLQLGGEAWTAWNTRVRDRLVSLQVGQGPLAGSFPADTEWARTGGRVYTTSLSSLTLAVYYRYLPLQKTVEPTSGRP